MNGFREKCKSVLNGSAGPYRVIDRPHSGSVYRSFTARSAVSACPAVLVPQPGGLGYSDIIERLHGVAQRARIVGFDLVELVPDADLRGLGVFTASRIVCVALGCIASQTEQAQQAADKRLP